LSLLAAETSRQRIDRPAAIARSLLPLAGIVIGALLIHGAGASLGQYPSRVMLDCGVAIIAAVSLTIVNGFTGQFSIGHAAFIAIGGYTAGFCTYYFALSRGIDPGGVNASLLGGPQWVMAAACILAGIVAAGIGWIVGLPSLRLRGDYLAIVTLGFGEIVRVLIQQTAPQIDSAAEFRQTGWIAALLPPAVGGSLGLSDTPKTTNLFWLFIAVGICLLFAFRLKYSSLGRALISIREDEIAAEAMGVNVTKLKVRAFVFAAFFAGVAGALCAHIPGVPMNPADAGFQRSFDIVMMVVLGGLGSISGATVAAILITLITAFTLALAEYDLLQYRMPVFAILLILMMIFRPRGIFGLNEIWDWLPGFRRKRNLLENQRGFDVEEKA